MKNLILGIYSETNMNPLLNNGRTDIFWRDINEDESIFEPENRNRAILVQTDVKDSPMSAVASMAKYVDMLNNRDYSLEETVTFYAFLT